MAAFSLRLVNAGVLDHPSGGGQVVGLVAIGGSRKLRNLGAEPRASIVARAGWRWATVEGEAEIIGPDHPHPDVDGEALRLLLRNIFRAAGGTHDDWDSYDRVMVEQRRAAVLIVPRRVYSNPPTSLPGRAARAVRRPPPGSGRSLPLRGRGGGVQRRRAHVRARPARRQRQRQPQVRPRPGLELRASHPPCAPLPPGQTALEHRPTRRHDRRPRSSGDGRSLLRTGCGQAASHRPGSDPQGLAVALANEPVVLLADEPTGELDGAAEEAVLGLLAAAADCGVAVVGASHSAAVAAADDRVLQLRDGMLT